MNNFLERIPSNLVNNSHHISQNLTAIRKSRTLMPNEDKASFLSNKRCSNNKQDKRGRRFVSFIEHFKKRSKSADQSNKQSFSQSAKSGDNLVGNESNDVTPTNENVNPYPSNCRSRNRPTSVDFHRIRKMHTSMKQFFTFNHYNNNSSRKDDLSQKSINNKVQVKENSVVNPSFFDSSYNNSNLNSPIVNTNNSSNRISLNCSNNTNFKGTILRSFSCTPKSNYESKKKFKSQTLKSQNISIDVTTTCNTNTTTCSSGL
ncbi:unnamed protein product, partial [Trichobilharzia regenti]